MATTDYQKAVIALALEPLPRKPIFPTNEEHFPERVRGELLYQAAVKRWKRHAKIVGAREIRAKVHAGPNRATRRAQGFRQPVNRQYFTPRPRPAAKYVPSDEALQHWMRPAA